MKQLAFLAFSLLLFVSCDDFENTATPSNTTFLPKMELQGNSFVQVACNNTYTDAGIEVTEGGNSLDFDVAINGSYFGATDVAGADNYVIAYSAVNKDGIPGSAFREVVVEPCNDGTPGDLSGLYTSNTLRSNGEGYDVSNVFVVRTGANTFAISDLVGGFYDLGRGYGSDYACKGSIITVNDLGSNDITVSQGQFPVWGNVVDVTDISVSGSTITFSVLADFGGEWDMVLTRL